MVHLSSLSNNIIAEVTHAGVALGLLWHYARLLLSLWPVDVLLHLLRLSSHAKSGHIFTQCKIVEFGSYLIFHLLARTLSIRDSFASAAGSGKPAVGELCRFRLS